ncbi:hypothetical protein ABMA28_008654 [Loxostege sticticalis]|uniref:SHOCT domain-containing protein n=1 Tax=Loxostege sticticalis TaxID=481309 RepID=A0ABD0SE88_LOXSC
MQLLSLGIGNNIIFTAHGVYCGLLTGDFKHHSWPLSIKNHHAPIQININSDILKPPFPPLSLPKPAKPPPDLSDLFKPSLFSKSTLPKLPSISKLPKLPSLSKPRLFSPFSPLSRLTSPLLPPIIPPLIPGLPFLPLLPPIIPPLPLLPLIPPILPGIPPILKPLSVPILGKSPLQKALGSELSPVTIKMPEVKKDVILLKLRDLLKKGSLTTAEFNRFKKLLVC